METPRPDWSTDEDLFASLPGGRAVIDWFGFCPYFHDSVLERLELSERNASLAIRAFRMTNATDANGYFILDRHALVTLQMRSVTGLRLDGDAGSIMSELTIRRLEEAPDPAAWETCAGPGVGDIEIAFDASVGLRGSIYTRDLAFQLDPIVEATSA
jgi:hypothetical protein